MTNPPTAKKEAHMLYSVETIIESANISHEGSNVFFSNAVHNIDFTMVLIYLEEHGHAY